jgi:hypothetical protein
MVSPLVACLATSSLSSCSLLLSFECLPTAKSYRNINVGYVLAQAESAGKGTARAALTLISFGQSSKSEPPEI